MKMSYFGWLAAAAGAAAVVKILFSGRGRFSLGGLDLRWG